MTKPIIKIVNVETGEELEREMNAAEVKQLEADKIANDLRIESESAKEAEKAALFNRLGITADEAAILLG